MLNNWRSFLTYHLQAASNSLSLICQKPIETSLTVVVLAIALTLPTLFWVFINNFEKIATNWQRGGYISLYLKPSLSASEEVNFLERLRKMETVGSVNLKSPAEGLAELQQQEGMQDIMRYLPENPLPTAIEVIPALGFTKPFQLDQLYLRLKAEPQVEQAKLDRQWITKLQAILGFATKIEQALMALLGLAVILIIGNTLRLAIHNRSEELRVLKLVGATDSFITRPFLYTGMWYSLMAAILALLFVNIFMLTLTLALKQLALAYQMHFPLILLSVKQAYLLVLTAVFLGWLGAKISVKNQLAFIEPYH